MESEMISGTPRVVVDGGDQGGKVGKLFFVAQEAHEFDSSEFTVSVNVTVEQVCFEHPAAGVGDRGAHAQTGHTGQGLVVQTVHLDDVDTVAQCKALRHQLVQCAIAYAAPQLLTMTYVMGQAKGIAEQRVGALEVAGGECFTQGRAGNALTEPVGNVGNRFDLEAILRPGATQEFDVSGAPVAVAKVLAN